MKYSEAIAAIKAWDARAQEAVEVVLQTVAPVIAASRGLVAQLHHGVGAATDVDLHTLQLGIEALARALEPIVGKRESIIKEGKDRDH